MCRILSKEKYPFAKFYTNDSPENDILIQLNNYSPKHSSNKNLTEMSTYGCKRIVEQLN